MNFLFLFAESRRSGDASTSEGTENVHDPNYRTV